MARKHKVKFLPDDTEVEVEQGENLLAAAMRAGVYLNASCGGEGTCGKCKVLVESGTVESERGTRLTDEEYAQGWRQACQSRAASDVTVRVPVEAQLDTSALGRTSRRSRGPGGHGARAGEARGRVEVQSRA